ncbi:MAG TPA: hypothetical protein VMF55_03075 [Solirubrobacterales bacterium]|nr:hypothetical protein [Solirubrobacterales bacterium]
MGMRAGRIASRIVGAVFVLVLVLAAAGNLVAAAPARAEEPTWWERCEELPGDQIEQCFYEHNGEKESAGRVPNHPADPVRRHIELHYPKAHSRFVNCPGNNRIVLENGEYGILCEFRFVLQGDVVKGISGVSPEGSAWAHATWYAVGFHAEPPAPKDWRHCKTPGWTASEPVRLLVRGTLCPEARHIAGDIASRALTSGDLRIPHHFDEGEYQTNTLGFVTSRFRCTGRVKVADPRVLGENPYGHETASCRTRFGDRLTYVFNQGS